MSWDPLEIEDEEVDREAKLLEEQKNANKFRAMFKRDFVEITNDDDVKSLEKKADSLYSKLLTWTSKFPSNKMAMQWKERELLKKKGVPDSAL